MKTVGPIGKKTWTPAPAPAEVKTVCRHLHGEQYLEYTSRTQTRNLGGVSYKQRSRIIRQLFPYKAFPCYKVVNDKNEETKNWSGDEEIETVLTDPVEAKHEVPSDGNKEVKSTKWTKSELMKHDETMRGWARWQVDVGVKVVRSTKCAGTTTNKDDVCEECLAVSKDESFKSDVRKVVQIIALKVILTN
jgi:hypothetical protein